MKEDELKDLSYHFPDHFSHSDMNQSPFLGELLGLASGAKKIALLELSSKESLDAFIGHLNYLFPNNNFEVIITPAYDWITEISKKYRLNAFIGKNKSDLLLLEEKYNRRPDNNNVHIEIGNLLSYPFCCSTSTSYPQKISERFHLGKANQIDFKMNNFFIRSPSNARIVLHYTCSYECKETMDYSTKVFDFIKNFPDILSFYNRVFKLPILMIAPNETPQRSVGDGVIFVFDGSYENENLLTYKRIYPLMKSTGGQYINVEEGESILKEMLLGNTIKIKDGGADIYYNDQLKKSIANKRLIFIWPN